MISASSFLEAGRARGFDFYSGVPCSFLTPLINRVIGDPSIGYVGATSEGEAVAIAAGAWLAGKRSVVICQNSGLGNTISPLTSLNWPFRIPTLLITTWRGQPGLGDEPQHELMGRIMSRLLDDIEVRHAPFPKAPEEIVPRLDQALSAMDETELPFALLMEKGSVEAVSLDQPAFVPAPAGRARDLTRGDGDPPTRIAVLERFLALVPARAAVIATTGKCGRELFTLQDRPQQLYQVGSMGCASAMGLGLALNSERPVVVLDGDGAALMKLGNLATIGAYRPANLVHILFDNGSHESTGGQATVSPGVDFAGIARACGYPEVYACNDLSGFAEALEASFAADGPALVYLRMKPGSLAKLGRPTIAPREVARRFRDFVLTG